MPVKVRKNLPAIGFLEKENIFVMSEDRAEAQEIRPLRVGILNLMPNKITTETQLLRLISNSPLQIEAVFIRTASYQSKNTDNAHLESFYKTTEEVIAAGEKFDGLIVTGAPVEQMDFEEVAYWDEFKRVTEWAAHNVYSTMYICWAAQAAVFNNYGIDKNPLENKIFGIFDHKVLIPHNPLVRCFNDTFKAPHSRHTQIDAETLFAEKRIDVLAVSDEAGVYLAASKDLRSVYVFGHGEYDLDSLHNEYIRDKEKGLKVDIPKNYYDGDKVGKILPISWRAHESLLVSNWLNYCVYQGTPYDIKSIK